MKRLYIAIIFLSSLNTGRSQKMYLPKKSDIAPLALVFLAGAADGLNNVISFKWHSFKKAFPEANTHYWWPSSSYSNKWENGKRENGERFFGSSTIFVAASDGWHLTRGFEHLFLSGALAIKIGQGKKNWKQYAVEAIGYWITNRVGFCAVFNSFK